MAVMYLAAAALPAAPWINNMVCHLRQPVGSEEEEYASPSNAALNR
jgi:hypothetical protein